MTVTRTGASTSDAPSFLEVFQRRHQPRDADGKTGCRHVLAGEAFYETVIAPAAADRTEDHFLALFIGDRERQLRFEDRSGVVFEATDA